MRTEELAAQLGITDKRLDGLRRQYRMDHGEEAEAKLERWLRAVHEQNRDRVRLLGKSGGYTENFASALHIRGPEGEQEPESVPADVQDRYSLDARTRRALDVERAREAEKAQIRAVSEALRARVNRGETVAHVLANVQRQLGNEKTA